MTGTRTILHVDLDAFFVSCELLRRPELRGRPVVVAGGGESHPGEARSAGRSVVSAASYEARPSGVRSALPLARALRLCPQLVVLPVDIDHYARISKQVFAIFQQYTPLVEPGSLDEAYLDVSGSQLVAGDGPTIAAAIQTRLADELGLPASVGVASCKTVAKVASDLRKPRGLVVVPPGQEGDFLSELALERLPGAGPKTVARLRLLGVTTLGDLALLDDARLRAVLGPQGEQLRDRARGHDPAPVVPPGVPRSLSRERTFARDLTDLTEAQRMVRLLSFAVARRLRAGGLLAGAVSLKARFADFQTTTRQLTLPRPASADLELVAAAQELLRRVWQPGVRLLGVGAEQLVPHGQGQLFEGPAEKGARLDVALDRLRDRFGTGAIARGIGSLGAEEDWNRDHLRQLGPPPAGGGGAPSAL